MTNVIHQASSNYHFLLFICLKVISCDNLPLTKIILLYSYAVIMIANIDFFVPSTVENPLVGFSLLFIFFFTTPYDAELVISSSL